MPWLTFTKPFRGHSVDTYYVPIMCQVVLGVADVTVKGRF